MKKLLILVPLLMFSCKKDEPVKFLCDCFTRQEQKNPDTGQFELQQDYGMQQDTCSEDTGWFYDSGETNRWRKICN